MFEVLKCLGKYLRALGFVSTVICVIFGTDISKLQNSTFIVILLYCVLLGTFIIWSAYYTYDFIKDFINTFHKE